MTGSLLISYLWPLIHPLSSQAGGPPRLGPRTPPLHLQPPPPGHMICILSSTWSSTVIPQLVQNSSAPPPHPHPFSPHSTGSPLSNVSASGSSSSAIKPSTTWLPLTCLTSSSSTAPLVPSDPPPLTPPQYRYQISNPLATEPSPAQPPHSGTLSASLGF